MKLFNLAAILLTGLLAACEPVIDGHGFNNNKIPANQGILEFRFILPSYDIPKDKIHRISLGFASSVDSLYRGLFFRKINVSDFQEVYSLFFLESEYYYDAVITCSCAGDTCLNGDFPGGRFGMKHTFDKFLIDNQKVTVVETRFQ